MNLELLKLNTHFCRCMYMCIFLGIEFTVFITLFEWFVTSEGGELERGGWEAVQGSGPSQLGQARGHPSQGPCSLCPHFQSTCWSP